MFKNRKYLSSGTYGKVYKIDYNGLFACMKEYIDPVDTFGVCDDILRELFHFSMPYSKISVYQVSTDFKNIVIDLYDGDLYLFRKNNRYSGTINDLKMIRTQITEQLYVLHSHGFIHSDVKIANVLYNKTNEVYTLCDFGLCEYYGFPTIKKKYICTDYFKAPENGVRNNINYDIYSLGATLYFLDDIEFTHKIDKQSVSNEIIQELIHDEHIISAKNVLNINNKNTKKLKYYKNITLKLGVTAEFEPYHNINENIFLNLSIKNEAYHPYTFSSKLYELDYLDDMFIMYMKIPFICNESNKIAIKSALLRKHTKKKTHLETLLFSWFLVDNVPFLGNIDQKSELTIYFNFSCKLLEFALIHKIDIKLDYIIEVEYNLIQQFINKKIFFTPAIFYIYYFLFKLAVEFPSQYNLEYRILESIILSILLIYLIRPVAYDTNMTYVKLSYNIIMYSIDFLYKRNTDSCLEKIVKETVSMLDSETIDIIIENKELKEYLTSNHT
jgi:serine/threonine protein kinase